MRAPSDVSERRAMAGGSRVRPKVAFSWNGLPQYAARLLRGALDAIGDDCAVIGSPPTVPVEGMERALRHKVHWVDADRQTTWRALDLEVPDIYFQSGWAYPAFSALGSEVRRNGGHVIGMSDANWRGDWRQVVLGAAAFRLHYRNHFDAMLVPGRQGEQLMRWFGLPRHRVRHGMYGADPDLFGGGPPLADRDPTFLFVGQFIDRKDVLGLAQAFVRIADRHPAWRLSLIGGGEQRSEIPAHPRITIEDFVQPEQLVDRFRAARFFVLPSLKEAWGLVVHEAALCGCGLILSHRIGSGDDLASTANGVRFRAGNVADLARALDEAARFDAGQLAAAEEASRRLACQFGPERFGREAAQLVQSFAKG
jgi:glycosyltransferase involved in cell wall biosynthesis